MNDYIKRAMIELEKGNYQGYQIYMHCHRVKRPTRKPVGDHWDREQNKFIKQNYQSMNDKELATALGRTIEAVKSQRKKLRLSRLSKRYWTKKEDDFLRQHFEEHSLKKMGSVLNRSPKQISYRLSKIGLSKVSKYDLYINNQQVASGTIREIADQIDANLYTVKRWRTEGVSWANFVKLNK
ncbi:hypothetical protein [Enterococcus devriesei]|uniref:hypothetical protein n=1 Tax=Enterococcus devriesei TaxID=319970 RepID=UPI0036D2D931